MGAQAPFFFNYKIKIMKINIVLVLLIVFCLSGCRDKTSDTEKEAAVVELSNNIEEGKKVKAPETIKDCDDFLDTYEAWTDDLIELMAQHKDDPVTLATSPDYINTMMKGVDFMEHWATISVSCSMNKTYGNTNEIHSGEYGTETSRTRLEIT